MGLGLSTTQEKNANQYNKIKWKVSFFILAIRLCLIQLYINHDNFLSVIPLDLIMI